MPGLFPSLETVRNQTRVFSANHYHRLDFMPVIGRGFQVYNEKGESFLDMFAEYGTMNFGHGHPRLIRALIEQARKISLVSGAVYHPLYAKLCETLAFFSRIPYAQTLLMNTGAEAVEKAIKIARRWGYQKKGIISGEAEIIVANGNFHGRTLGVLSASTEENYRLNFGPLLDGFLTVPFGDFNNLELTVANVGSRRVAAILLEPIQSEGGFIFSPPDYLPEVSNFCQHHNILLILDEIPTALGRTGYDFPHRHEQITPDMVVVGKALGGGLLPISAVIARSEVMEVLDPGSDGSTFGGNPLACAVALEALEVLKEESLSWKSQGLGEYFLQQLQKQDWPVPVDIRGRGLLIGLEIGDSIISAREVCEDLLKNEGVWTHYARRDVVRLTPPLTIGKEQIDFTVRALVNSFRRLASS